MSNMSVDEKPKLPAWYYVNSPIWTAMFIAYAVGMYALCGAGIWWVFTQDGPLWLRVPAIAMLVFLGQQGLHLLAWVGHEGFHFNLHRNHVVSCVLGIVFSSMIASFLQIGASISHWNHHLHTNLEEDPDIPIFRKFKTAFMRILCARTYANGIYRRNAILLVRGKELPYATFLPFSRRVVQRLAWLNLACSSAWLVAYAVILVKWPVFGLTAIVVPHVAASFYTSIRSYLEHADTGVGDFVNARTRTSPILTVLYFGNNYHLEHHLFPSVACYRLPSVHAMLKKAGAYDRPGVRIDRTIGDAYKHAGTRYTYPEPPPKRQLSYGDTAVLAPPIADG